MKFKLIVFNILVLCLKLSTAEEESSGTVVLKTCTNTLNLSKRSKCEHFFKDLYKILKEANETVSVPNVCNSIQKSGCFADPKGNFHCTQNITEVVCKCPAGYVDVGAPTDVTGVFCQDIDECLEGTDKCASHGSKCTNTLGSYTCDCLENFFGNGKQCDVKDACMKKDFCPDNSKCENIKKYQGCFEQMIKKETVIEKMNADDCIKHCRKKSFEIAIVKENKCSCDNKTPAVKVDNDKCNTPCYSNNQKCGGIKSFVSVYKTGKLSSCRCLEGFIKKDGACVDVNECEEEGICPSKSLCVNKVGSYTCHCDDGYIMTSSKECKMPIVKQCENFTYREKRIRENLELWYDCNTVVLLDCNYEGESYMKDGDVFYSVQKGKLGRCKDGVLEYNKNIVRDSATDLYRANVKCESNEQLVVKIDKFALNSNGFSKSNIFVGPHDLSVNETRDKYQENPACKPTVVYEDGAFYKFVINRGECGLSYTYDIEKRENLLRGRVHGKTEMSGRVSTISKLLNIEFTCHYKNDRNDLIKEKRALKENVVLNSEVKKTKLVDKTKRNSGISLDENLTFRHKLEWVNTGDIVPLQLSSVIVTPHAENGIDVIDVIPGQEIQLHLSISSSDFVIQPVRCWIEDLKTRSKHVVVKNGCNSYKASNELLVEFEPVSFEGGEIEEQHFSCFIKLCKKEDNCMQECKTILEGGEVGMEMNWSTKMVGAPYKIVDQCGPKHRGGCDHYCTRSTSNGAVCSCEENFVLVENKHCEVIVGGVLSAQQPWIVQVTVILVVVLIVLIIVCYVIKKKMEAKHRHQKYSFARDEHSDLGEVVNNTILQ